MSFDRIGFILSSPRSGSTLLRLHLNQHPEIIALPETHFFNFKAEFSGLKFSSPSQKEKLIYKWVNYFTVSRMDLDTEALTRELNDGHLDWKTMFEKTLIHYWKAYHPEVKRPYWIEKTPPHIFYQADIKAMYPHAKFIYLVRDPRAVVGSLRLMSFSTSNVWTIAQSWKKSVHQMKFDSDAITLKYEALVKEPESHFESIYQHLGIPAAVLEKEGLPSDPVERKNWNSAETLKPINAENTDKWKKTLSRFDGHIPIIETTCRAEMKELGYEPMNLKKFNNYYVTYFASMLHFVGLKFLNILWRKNARSSG